MANLYVQLDVNFPDDPKIMAAGVPASGLYAQAMCLTKRLLTDGVLTRAQLRRLGEPSEIDELIAKCVSVGLFIEVDFYTLQIAAWLTRNASADAIRANANARANAMPSASIEHASQASPEHDRAKKGAYAAHVRWHLNGRVPKQGCEYCNPQVNAHFEHSDAMPPSMGMQCEPHHASRDRDRVETETYASSSSALPVGVVGA